MTDDDKEKIKIELYSIYHFVKLFPVSGDNTRREIIDFFSGSLPIFYNSLHIFKMDDVINIHRAFFKKYSMAGQLGFMCSLIIRLGHLAKKIGDNELYNKFMREGPVFAL